MNGTLAITLGTILGIGPMMVAGSAIAADRAATVRRATPAAEMAPVPQPLYYGGTLAPIEVIGRAHEAGGAACRDLAASPAGRVV